MRSVMSASRFYPHLGCARAGHGLLSAGELGFGLRGSARSAGVR
jgi:hypothetical protein